LLRDPAQDGHRAISVVGGGINRSAEPRTETLIMAQARVASEDSSGSSGVEISVSAAVI
jgi:hypothetical protein